MSSYFRDTTLAAADRVRHLASLPAQASLIDLLSAIPKGGAIVAPIVTDVGTAVFVVKAGSQRVGPGDVVWIDEFTIETLDHILVGTPGKEDNTGWLSAYFRRKLDKRNWQRVIVDMGSTLWRALLEPVDARLATMALEVEAQLILLLPPGLNTLPLHSSWRNQQGRLRYALDDYTISYCPSMTVLLHATRRLRTYEQLPMDRKPSLLIVANPDLTLPFADIEGHAIASLGRPPQTTLLCGKSASWPAVLAAHKKQAYIHFACHGSYNPEDPLHSYLALSSANQYPGATGNLWLLELVAGWDCESTRLVTMSACETAITDITTFPNEYLGLSSGWLRSGAIGVISSLWLVDDLCALLLMDRFYRLHFPVATGLSENSPKLAPAAALRAAQLWLKGISNQAVCEQLAAFERQDGLSDVERKLLSFRRREFAASPLDDKPFSDPFWWAGFILAGA